MNIGQAMDPKSGQFVTPEPGLYLFLITCCTYDMKKCLVSIRKNGKDVANLFDQDGDTNKVFFKSIYKKRWAFMNMAIPDAEFSREGYKVERFLGKTQMYSNEITKF